MTAVYLANEVAAVECTRQLRLLWCREILTTTFAFHFRFSLGRSIGGGVQNMIGWGSAELRTLVVF